MASWMGELNQAIANEYNRKTKTSETELAEFEEEDANGGPNYNGLTHL